VNSSYAATTYAVDSSNLIWLLDLSPSVGWAEQPGGAIDVAAGQGGTPTWVVGSNNKLYSWNGTGWTVLSGGPTTSERVSIGEDGTVWIVDSSGNIWNYM
jgi:hypothetical protein